MGNSHYDKDDDSQLDKISDFIDSDDEKDQRFKRAISSDIVNVPNYKIQGGSFETNEDTIDSVDIE